MYILKYSIQVLFVFILFSPVINAQSGSETTKQTLSNSKKPVEVRFGVRGVCSMCKKRIEKAALIRGVKLAEWDKKANNLRVIYRADKVSEIQIQEAVAAAGHDTDLVKSSNEDYETLPGCCAYREGVKVH